MPSATGPARSVHPLLHLARCLVGEGDREDFPWPRPAGGNEVGDPRRQDAGLAGPGPGQHEDGSVYRFDSLTLLGVQPVEVANLPVARTSAIGDAADPRRGHHARSSPLSGAAPSNRRAEKLEQRTNHVRNVVPLSADVDREE